MTKPIKYTKLTAALVPSAETGISGDVIKVESDRGNIFGVRRYYGLTTCPYQVLDQTGLVIFSEPSIKFIKKFLAAS